MAISQDKRLLSITTDAGHDVLLLDQVAGVEQISRPFQFDLTLMAERAADSPSKVKVRDLIGTMATVAVGLPDGTKRYFSGMISRMAQGGVDREFVHYRATLVPAMTLMQLASNCRIFQNMSAKEVLEEVIAQYSSVKTEYHLTGTYTRRDYCTQYRETDFAFVTRLMEEEGIFYYFKHTDKDHTLVIGDNADAYAACPVNAKVVFGPSRLTSEEALLDSWHARYQLLTGKWTMRDYDFQQPRNKLEGSAPAVQPADVASGLEMYEWPGGNVTLFNEPDKRAGDVQTEADAFAELRMEQEEVQAEIFDGTGNAAGLTAGHTFEVSSRGEQTASGKYVLTTVNHSATQNPPYLAERAGGTYTNRFSCLKSTVVYRPPLATAKPLVHGLQTAVVVDESDSGDTEEIWPDKYGRVRVRFPWDRDGNFACWVRVAQQRAGKHWGFIWIPRVGDEVVISYLEGDPDHPLIVGSLYNADNPVPYTLPDCKTQHGIKTMSTPNGGSDNYNEFFIEDKKGEELIRLHAEKDLHTEVENDEIRKVEHDRTTTIKNDETKTVEDGDETHTVKTGKRTTTIHADEILTVETGKCSLEVQQGDHLITVKQGKQATKVDMGDQTNEVGMGNQSNNVKMGNITSEAGMGNIETTAKMGNITTNAKLGNITIKADLGKITLEALQGIELKVGPSSVKIDMSGIQISGLMTKVEGTVQTQVKGLITQVTADAMLKAGGAITMIG
ncbi:MAG TPA: type VI secretion system tip protein TssI/VgrG [Gemmatimonadales bacterium]|nr:type VI secretion system tip protein TssI/VgrG [Gemmatimonadales bacterium]